jgi:uncharacterized membrane protein YphA (DoxX/SURF4 family)
MRLGPALRDLPGRWTTGVYILHAGYDKWKGTPETAAAVHSMASNTYPFLKPIPPEKFLKILAAGELATGALLVLPKVSNAIAGSALSGFAGGLVVMYLRTPGMHKPRSYWPTSAGTGVSKDIWMLGIGAGLVVDALTSRRSRGKAND